MIIQCDKCGTKFRLDDSRVTGNGVRVRCTKCQNVFIVAPPPPVDEVQAEDVLSSPDRQAAEAARKPAPPVKRLTEELNLKFDFSKPQEGQTEERKSSEPLIEEKAAESKAKVPTSFDEIDFSFSTDRSAGREFTDEPAYTTPAADAANAEGKKDWDLGGEGKPAAGTSDNWDLSGNGKPAFETSNGWDLGGEGGEKPASNTNGGWDLAGPGESAEGPGGEAAKDTDEKPPFSDIEFGSRAGKESADTAADTNPPVKETAARDTSAEEPRVNASETAQKESPFAAAYGSDGRSVHASASETQSPGSEGVKFSQYFSEEMAKGEKEEAEEFDNGIIGEVEEGEDEEGSTPEVPERSASNRALLVAAIVFLVGGAIIYFSGIIDTLATRLTPSSQVAAQKTVEIETITGRFIENKRFGKFFVVSATIRNITDLPQPVKAVTGVLYDAKGQKLAFRSVAPGRVVSADDLENLAKDDLLKPFKDPSGGTLPPKGTVPVMIPFTEPPQGIAEYGIDIVR